MSFDEFRDHVKRYAAKAKINANCIEFMIDEGVYTARCEGVMLIGGRANNLIKVIWGRNGRNISAIYGCAHVSAVAVTGKAHA